MLTQIGQFDVRFRSLHERSLVAVNAIPAELLFERPEISADHSFGEYVLRSAGAVEQTFGGITARLWDDPFEWTLPEELSTNAKIAEYLEEVEATRTRGFLFFKSDADLGKQIPAPEKLTSIFDLLVDTLARSERLQERAFAIFHLIAGVRPSQL